MLEDGGVWDPIEHRRGAALVGLKFAFGVWGETEFENPLSSFEVRPWWFLNWRFVLDGNRAWGPIEQL